MARFNPFFNLDEARCLAHIEHVQRQIAANARQITAPGGGAMLGSLADGEYIIWQLQCRLAEIRGTSSPAAPSRIASRRRGMSFTPVNIDMGY